MVMRLANKFGLGLEFILCTMPKMSFQLHGFVVGYFTGNYHTVNMISTPDRFAYSHGQSGT